MDITKYWLIKKLDLDIDCNNLIIQLLLPLRLFTNKLHKILGKPVSIRKIDNNKLLKFIYADNSICIYREDYIHCGRGYNDYQIQKLLDESKNVVIFKCPFNLWSKYLPNITIYNVVMNYIKNNPNKLYIFGNKKSECNFPNFPNVCFLDE